MGENRTGPYSRRLTVAQAAEHFGISAEAVRGRIRRGTLPVEREGGAVYALREANTGTRTTGDQPDDHTDQLIAEMQNRIRSLEEANRENRRIIAALTSRIPELEAPGSPVSSAEASEGRSPGPLREASARPQRGHRRERSRAGAAGGESSLGSGNRRASVDSTEGERDALVEIARDLVSMNADLAALKGAAFNWLSAPEYGALRHRLEDAHASVEAAAVEARRRVRLNEGR